MPQKHLFIMDPFEKLNLELDSSLRMAYCLKELGHQIYFGEARDLVWSNQSPVAHLKASPLLFQGAPNSAHLGSGESTPLDGFQGIHMRKDPPYDMNYITCTWFLDSAPKSTKVLNSPEILRNFNEKLGTFMFSQWMLPTCTSASPRELMEFIRTLNTPQVILKPLDLFGGRGVEKMPTDNLAAIHSKLNSLTQDGQVAFMVQPFDPAVSEGEIRAFTAGGETLTWCKKVPAPGNFLANTRAGAKLMPHTPTKAQAAAVSAIAQKMLTLGAFLTGIDLIGDHVSEVNITSPRLLTAEPGDLDPYRKVASLIEHYCN
jgi:glutathione synthase